MFFSSFFRVYVFVCPTIFQSRGLPVTVLNTEHRLSPRSARHTPRPTMMVPSQLAAPYIVPHRVALSSFWTIFRHHHRIGPVSLTPKVLFPHFEVTV